MAARHSIDPALSALLASRPNIHVVTRNRHAAQIEQFITSHGGNPAFFTVHSVQRQSGDANRSSKAAVILSVLEAQSSSPAQSVIDFCGLVLQNEFTSAPALPHQIR